MSFNRPVRLRDTGLLALLGGAALSLLAVSGHAQQTVTMTVDAAQNVKPISRYIYGINYGNNAPLDPALNLTLRRMGGNRWTAYNWENNASNAGSDYIFQNDGYLGGGNTPGGALIPAINDAHANSAALLATVPINGYVAADKNADGDVRNSGPNYLQTRFRQDRAVKGAPFTLAPDPTDPYVYQDEFVNWVKTTFPYSQQAGTASPIWFCLDNEPDLWQETHLEVHPDPPLYSELVSKGTSYAGAIKAVAPNTLVFGPVSYGWYGYVRLQDAPDANNRDFLDFYLSQMKAASDAAGKRLLDVLDLHWYPEAQSSDGIRITGTQTSATVVAARLQAPRSLWDSTYVEHSWITEDWIHGPINLLPLLAGKIANNYPDTKLAFTEYNYGAGQHISGGIAQADVLGIFGRYGVFAATQWPLQENADGTPAEPFVGGAFRMYRNFDGRGGGFGDTSVDAQTSDIPGTSVYASLDSTNAKRMVLVVINKTANPITAVVNLNNAPVFKRAAIYQLTGASALPVAQGAMLLSNPAQFSYNMPPYSVSTLNLSAGSSHDFNGDGSSDLLWHNSMSGQAVTWLVNGTSVIGGGSLGSVGNPWAIVGQRDFNGDGFADLLWRNGTTGQAVAWFLNGTSVIGGGSLGSAASPWSVAGTGDFNGDGFGDVLWYNMATGQAVIWLLNGSTVIGGGSPGSAASPWIVAGTGDFNGDSKADLLWYNTSTGQAVIWFLDGTSVVGGGSIGSAASPWTVAGTGDFNGDGKSDVLWYHTTSGQVVVWLLDGASVIGGGSPGSAGSPWTIAGTGDFNGDSKSDIVWSNPSTGQLVVWLLNGTSVIGGGSPGSAASPWQIQGLSAD
jgi:Glycoside hydrolase family 44/FG-GAP-like repeat